MRVLLKVNVVRRSVACQPRGACPRQASSARRPEQFRSRRCPLQQVLHPEAVIQTLKPRLNHRSHTEGSPGHSRRTAGQVPWWANRCPKNWRSNNLRASQAVAGCRSYFSWDAGLWCGTIPHQYTINLFVRCVQHPAHVNRTRASAQVPGSFAELRAGGAQRPLILHGDVSVSNTSRATEAKRGLVRQRGRPFFQEIVVDAPPHRPSAFHAGGAGGAGRSAPHQPAVEAVAAAAGAVC